MFLPLPSHCRGHCLACSRDTAKVNFNALVRLFWTPVSWAVYKKRRSRANPKCRLWFLKRWGAVSRKKRCCDVGRQCVTGLSYWENRCLWWRKGGIVDVQPTGWSSGCLVVLGKERSCLMGRRPWYRSFLTVALTALSRLFQERIGNACAVVWSWVKA